MRQLFSSRALWDSIQPALNSRIQSAFLLVPFNTLLTQTLLTPR
jgi:hypothetical protein